MRPRIVDVLAERGMLDWPTLVGLIHPEGLDRPKLEALGQEMEELIKSGLVEHCSLKFGFFTHSYFELDTLDRLALAGDGT